MTSAWAGWSRFDIQVDRYGEVHALLGVHALLICTIVNWSFLPATELASRKILIEQNIKKRTGPAL
jgi:transposase